MEETYQDLVLNIAHPVIKKGTQKIMKRKRKDKQSSLQRNRPPSSPVSDSTDVVHPVAKKRKSSQASSDHPMKKKKHTKPEKKQKLAKFSSLFNKNPDIPKVKSTEVDHVKEEVFSGETFSSLGIHPHMVANLANKMEISQMTAVQKITIPRILEGKDVLVKSQTGSGKTLAYAVPIAHQLQQRKPCIQRQDGPYAIVIVPTRELATQSFDVLQKLLSTFVWIVPGSIMGGEKRKSEKARLRKGVNVLVSTPGRLLDHLQNTNCLTLSHIHYLVIDEADRLLDLGFEKAVSQIIQILNDKSQGQRRQTILLSATLSAGVERLAGMSLQEPVKISVSDAEALSRVSQISETKRTSVGQADANDEKFTTPDSLQHYFVIVPSKLRLVTLAAFILWKAQYSGDSGKMVVFLPTQDSVEFHHCILEKILCSPRSSTRLDRGNAESDLLLFKLHGDMEQKDRTRVFKEFCDASSGVLLCTDVAARGLDLPAVRWIVQHSSPGSSTDYIHRVGRTARIGQQGKALLFLSPSEVEYVKVLANCNISMSELSVDDILKSLLMPLHQHLLGSTKSKNKTTQQAATDLQILFEEQVQDNKDIGLLARSAYQSFVRSYATYPSHLKHIFHVKHLHLGHVAKSFGLQDSPSNIGEFITSSGWGAKKWSDKKTSSRRHQAVSEYGSGLGKPSRMTKSQREEKTSPQTINV